MEQLTGKNKIGNKRMVEIFRDREQAVEFEKYLGKYQDKELALWKYLADIDKELVVNTPVENYRGYEDTLREYGDGGSGVTYNVRALAEQGKRVQVEVMELGKNKGKDVYTVNVTGKNLKEVYDDFSEEIENL